MTLADAALIVNLKSIIEKGAITEKELRDTLPNVWRYNHVIVENPLVNEVFRHS